MRVDKVKAFTPTTITLETQEDWVNMLAILNYVIHKDEQNWHNNRGWLVRPYEPSATCKDAMRLKQKLKE